MPDVKPPPTGGPATEGGSLGDPVQPCEANDVEAVCDLDEPNGIATETEHDEDEPIGLLFTATALEPGGAEVALSPASGPTGG